MRLVKLRVVDCGRKRLQLLAVATEVRQCVRLRQVVAKVLRGARVVVLRSSSYVAENKQTNKHFINNLF